MTQATLDLDPLNSEAVDGLVARALANTETAADLEALKAVKLAFLGDRASLILTNRKIGQLAPTDRGTVGENLSGARAHLSRALTEHGQILEAEHEARVLVEESVGVTAPNARSIIDAHHPIGTLTGEVEDFFTPVGWGIAEGPEIGHEQFNFDSLNSNIDHLARQMQDTFYVGGTTIGGEAPKDGCLVIRIYTPPVQSRSLFAHGAPLYTARPGKVLRPDALDATHTPVFHQVKGLVVDKGLTMVHLEGALDHFAKAMFGSDAKARLRSPPFPFTESSAEPDMWFPQKEGGVGRVRVGGCGTVNPNVLRTNGIDPDEYTGFAFGMDIERMLTLRYGIIDMYNIVKGGIRFSQQFGLRGKGH